MQELFDAQHGILRSLLAGETFDVATCTAPVDSSPSSTESTEPAAPGMEVAASTTSDGQLGTFVEVGCGSSEAAACLLREQGSVEYVGLDIAKGFLDMSRTLLDKVAHRRTAFALLQGNALELFEVMQSAAAAALAVADVTDTSATDEGHVVARALKSPCLVGCLMNSMGIFSPEGRETVVKAMIRVAGNGGAVLLGCWAAAEFRRGVEEFYKKQPELCGTITDDMVDLEAATLHNPDAPGAPYSSQWWRPEQLVYLFPSSSRARVEVAHVGIGIFACLRVSEADVAAAGASS